MSLRREGEITYCGRGNCEERGKSTLIMERKLFMNRGKLLTAEGKLIMKGGRSN